MMLLLKVLCRHQGRPTVVVKQLLEQQDPEVQHSFKRFLLVEFFAVAAAAAPPSPSRGATPPGTPGGLDRSSRKHRRSSQVAQVALVQQVLNNPLQRGVPVPDTPAGRVWESASACGGAGGGSRSVAGGAARSVVVDLDEKRFSTLIQQMFVGANLGREFRKALLSTNAIVQMLV